jgi:hypothetical protein
MIWKMIQRVTYSERQILTAEVLNQEQAYRLASHRQHNLAAHDWGILQGLNFYWEDGQLWLAGGVAVDGYGRELFASEPFRIQRELFTALYPGNEEEDVLVIDLWLRYAREKIVASQKGIGACDPDQMLRSKEEARLCITRPAKDDQGNPKNIDPRYPSAIPADDVDFPPFREPPDDPNRPWPVYLGRIRWSKGSEFPAPDESIRRPYANLVGALLHSASRQPAPEDPKNLTASAPVVRAQVEMAPPFSGSPPFSISCTDDQGNLTRRLAVTGMADIRAQGHMIVVSELTEDERMQLQVQGGENGKLSTLHIGGREEPYDETMILHPSRLARKILVGVLPLQKDVQKSVNTSIEKLFSGPLDTLEQKKNLRQGLASLLNDIVRQESLTASPRLQTLRLRRDTWDLIHSRSKEPRPIPINTRIVSELLSGELRADTTLEPCKVLEVAPLGLPETKQAMPWNIYRLEKQDEKGATVSELRIENLDPGDKDDPTLYEFVIGSLEQQGTTFLPCMSVDAGCNVTIHGTLKVVGELIQSPVQVDPQDPRYVDQLVQSWNQGVSAAEAAASSLQATIKSLSVGTDAWEYTLMIENKSKILITNIRVFETYSFQGKVNPTSQVDQIPSLPVDDKDDRTITRHIVHKPKLSGPGTLYVAVSVQGRLPSGITAYASAQGSLFVPPPVG